MLNSDIMSVLYTVSVLQNKYCITAIFY
uniref:Uncharacterized protein n=1 Tax=Anguilla anguilla TaxID=7936 RepID=A0A0E9QKL7_ANGAN